MKVVVLFPKGGVSKIQQAQMLSAEGENVKVLEVDGDFDFCQSTVKEIFSDQKLQLYREAYNLLSYVKKWMKLKRFLPYEEIAPFHPKKSYPSWKKE